MNNNEIHFKISDLEHAIAVVKDLTKALQVLLTTNSLVLYFHGDLGVGKTFFIQQIISNLLPGQIVKSPTYSIAEEYDYNEQKLFHFDFYRLNTPEELEYLGIREYFENFALLLIEWPDKGAGYILPADLELTLAFDGNTLSGRTLMLRTNSNNGLKLIDGLLKYKT